MTAHLTTPDGTPISRFAFGAMQWGGTADETAARGTYDAARAAGINHFDTAYVYTGGASETMLGQFAKAERDRLFIATKVAYSDPSTRKTIFDSFDVSRKRLDLDAVDLLYLHRFDDTTPLEETFEALAELQQSGGTRFIGVSNFAAWQVMKAQGVARSFGTRIDFIQPMYNLVKRQVEVEILPVCADQGIEVASYSPLGGGLLTGKYSAGGEGRIRSDDRYAARYGPAWMHDAARGLADLAKTNGTDAATLAVAWLARHAPAVRPILSARNADQLAASLAGMTYQMGDDLYAAITALSPTPPPATDRIEEA